MKPAAEFEEITGRFERIDDLLIVCRGRADVTHDMGYATLVLAVQTLRMKFDPWRETSWLTTWRF